MDRQWNIINDEKDIEYVLTRFGHFHDSCIKEVKYTSGSFVNEDCSMKPFDDLSQVHMIIQRQNIEHSVIEIVFEGVERFNLVPAREGYDSVIFHLHMKKKDNRIYVADEIVDIDEFAQNSDWLTWIRATSAKWREVNQYIGDSLVYIHRD